MRSARMQFLSFKSKCVVSLFGILIFAFAITIPRAEEARATTISWTQATVESSFAASSTRALYDSGLGAFAIDYLAAGGMTFKFASSTDGSSWAKVDFDSVPLSGSAIATANFFATSSIDAGGFYAIGMRGGADDRVFSAVHGGSSFNTYDIPFDFLTDGNLAQSNDVNRTYMVVGGKANGGTYDLIFATTTPSTVATFTTTTIVTGLAHSPNVDFAYVTNKLAVVYTDLDGNLYMATSSGYNPATWGTYNFATGYTIAMHPRVRMDSTGKIWVAYAQTNDGVCSVSCSINVARYEPTTGWTNEEIDAIGSIGSVDFSDPTDIAFINGTTPVVVYYSRVTNTLRYAYRDEGGSGCSGSAAAHYTCGDVATPGGAGTYAIASNGGTKLVTSFYSYTSGAVKAAYADVAAVLAGGGSAAVISGLPAPVPILNPQVVVNDGMATTTQRRVQLHITGSSSYPIQGMAISESDSFYGEVWQSYNADTWYTLKSTPGTQRIYVKLGNNTGAVSDVTSVDVTYDPNFGIVTPPVLPPAPATATSTTPVEISQPPTTPVPLTTNPPEELGPYVAPFASEILMLPPPAPAPVKLEPLCPERPNAFSVGGQMIEDRATFKRYVQIDTTHTLCPVLNNYVRASWGYPGVKLVSKLPAYKISSPLPYRPGTILRGIETGATYFVNTKGRVHPFPNHAQWVKLGYSAAPVMYIKSTALAGFPAAVALTRIDIHPDGTLFVLNKAKGEYAILQERELHTISAAKLLFYHESLARAIHFSLGESYPYGDTWN